MRTRLGLATVCVLGGLLVGTLFGPRPTAAQIGSNRGFFSTLKVGDMVETAYDSVGKTVLRTYDDEANKVKMIARVTDIGGEFIVLEIKSPDPMSKEVWSVRYPVQSIGSIFHVSGAAPPGSDPTVPNDVKGKTPTKTKKGVK